MGIRRWCFGDGLVQVGEDRAVAVLHRGPGQGHVAFDGAIVGIEHDAVGGRAVVELAILTQQHEAGQRARTFHLAHDLLASGVGQRLDGGGGFQVLKGRRGVLHDEVEVDVIIFHADVVVRHLVIGKAFDSGNVHFVFCPGEGTEQVAHPSDVVGAPREIDAVQCGFGRFGVGDHVVVRQLMLRLDLV